MHVDNNKTRILREIEKVFEFIKTFIVGILSVSELFLWHSISYQRFKSHRDAYEN